ncbi:hypothetical protein BU15DRAFT_69216 [Melanogaster broomeanus]|nr:hypothetical protein BU15DRAFT_69216 [Melanogaster broomeanus]
MSWLKAKDQQSGVEYSSLFHSGLRAISLLSRARSSSVAFAPSSPSSSEESAHGSRSSATSLSSRLFNRRKRGSQRPATSRESYSPSPLAEKKVVRPRPLSVLVHSTTEISEPWASGGEGCQKLSHQCRFFALGYSGHYRDDNRATYSFSSLARSRSFFVKLADINTNPIAPKDVPLLSLSGSAEAPLQHALPRRARPASMQTMTPSHLSSFHHRKPEIKREKLDRAWMLEESSPELQGQDFGDDEDVSDLSLDSDVADWRQFHVDWLENEPTIQLRPVPED